MKHVVDGREITLYNKVSDKDDSDAEVCFQATAGRS